MASAWTRVGGAFVPVCLLLVAFVLQTAVARGHFHFGVALDGVQISALADGEGGEPANVPSGHDESNCSLWRAASVYGAAIVPVAPAIFVPQVAFVRAMIDLRRIFPKRFTVAWRSRAPPSL